MDLLSVKVRCKLCGYTTCQMKEEAQHLTKESIKKFEGSEDSKKILTHIFEEMVFDFENLERNFNVVLYVINEPKRFKLLENIMERVNNV